MRRWILSLSVASLLIAALSACGQKTEQVAQTSNDSLLSSNPVEQPAGDISPQTDYQNQTPETPAKQETHAPAPTPKKSTTSSHTPSSNPPASHPVEHETPGTLLAAGTPIQIAVNTQISSETSQLGDTWTGEVKEPVVVGNIIVIPAGSQVEGTITGVRSAKRGDRAALDLAVSSVSVNGTSYPVTAGTDSIIAGSTRARNLGAVAGGAAAGALIGTAVGGGGKGALIGGLIGGATAGTAVAKSKGYQVVVKEGTIITFNVNKDVRVRS